MLRIDELDAGGAGEWDRYVNQHPDSNCYHLSAWRQVASEAYALPAPFLVARTDGDNRIRGVLPLFHVRGLLRKHLTNGLFGAYASVLGDSLEIRSRLLESALGLCQRLKASLFVLKTLSRPELAIPSDFDHQGNWVIATLALDPDAEKVWTGLRDKIRNCVRKARRFGLEVRSGADQLRPFYEVLAENMHTKGTPIYGYEFVQGLWAHLSAPLATPTATPSATEVITLWHKDRCVAGAFVIFHRKRAYVPFASSLPSSLSMCPNNLLYWEIIRKSCERGIETLDFGRSIRGSGTLKFKEGWGARIEPQPCYLRSFTNHNLSLNPDTPLVNLFVRGWQALPRGVADTLGPSFCKQMAGLL
jgi:serine/alanine adding enzyme